VSGPAWTLIKSWVPKSLKGRLRVLRAALRPEDGPDRLQACRDALLISHSQISGFEMVLVPRQPHRPDHALNSAFYDRQHEDAAYRRNNWLLDQLPAISSMPLSTVVEIGCGNGRFLRAVAPYARQVIGVDWAQSPELLNLPANVEVQRVDVAAAPVPCGDLICSADVLEHFAPKDIDLVVAKLVGAGRYQHHVIACYDDGHTHLSILPPAAWLAVFRRHSQTVYLADVHYRRNDPAQIVCVVSNLPRPAAEGVHP
jgi:SAM-dependent methyltransferase